MELNDILSRLGVDLPKWTGDALPAHSPRDGATLATLAVDTAADAASKIDAAHAAFLQWRKVPAPQRGELVRLLGNVLRENKSALGRLVTLEAGKIASEGLGEVQEMIDICDFAVGLSRQLYGLTIASERPGHRMMETWHPLGVCGVISAFNFPVAVWSWNAALAFVCGDAVVWKPSEKTPLTAIACQTLFEQALAQFEKSHPGVAPQGLSQVLIGAREAGEALTGSPKVPLVSATGSVRMGMEVAQSLSKRLGRSILELGGNNAMIVAPSADLDLVVRAVTFSRGGHGGAALHFAAPADRASQCRRGLVAAPEKAFRFGEGGRSAGNRYAGRTADRPCRFRRHATGTRRSARAGRRGDQGGERVDVTGLAQAFYVRPAIVRMPAQSAVVRARDLRADPVCADL